jgi:hypothetical protein
MHMQAPYQVWLPEGHRRFPRPVVEIDAIAVVQHTREIPDDGPKPSARQDEDRDQLAVELEGFG